MKTLIKLIEKAQIEIDQDLQNDFINIIISHTTGNYGKNKAALKSFFEDMQKGGCISGIIGEFIYHADCKNFYIKHIDALEDFNTELTEQIGEPIKNRHNLPHYTFIVWLVFEEYCYQVYNNLFEQ